MPSTLPPIRPGRGWLTDRMGVRRVVTGHDESGKSVFASDETVEPDRPVLLPAAEFYQLWGGDATPQFPDDGSTPQLAHLLSADRRVPVRDAHHSAGRRAPPNRSSSTPRRQWPTSRASCPDSCGTWTRRIPACTPPTPSTSKWCWRARSCWSSTTAPRSRCTRRHRGAERHATSVEEPWRHPARMALFICGATHANVPARGLRVARAVLVVAPLLSVGGVDEDPVDA